MPDIAELVKLFSLLSSTSRLKLLSLLSIEPHCVCDLQTHTHMSQSLISHHLSDLVENELISRQRKGKYIEYFLTKKGENIIKAIEHIKS